MSKKFKLRKNSIIALHGRRTLVFRIFNKLANGILIFLYKIYFLPLFGIGRKIVLIHTLGRKTGKKRTTPTLIFTSYTGIWTLYVARGRKSNWLNNILAISDGIIRIQKGFKTKKVKAKLMTNKEEKFKHLKFYLERLPEANMIFGYNKKKHGDVSNSAEFASILEKIEFVQLEFI